MAPAPVLLKVYVRVSEALVRQLPTQQESRRPFEQHRSPCFLHNRHAPGSQCARSAFFPFRILRAMY